MTASHARPASGALPVAPKRAERRHHPHRRHSRCEAGRTSSTRRPRRRWGSASNAGMRPTRRGTSPHPRNRRGHRAVGDLRCRRHRRVRRPIHQLGMASVRAADDHSRADRVVSRIQEADRPDGRAGPHRSHHAGHQAAAAAGQPWLPQHVRFPSAYKRFTRVTNWVTIAALPGQRRGRCRHRPLSRHP